MRVLISEDDSISRTALRSVLNKRGYQVIEASDGAQAWKNLQEPDPPRLLILDIMMPEMSGLELCRRIRSWETHNPPYIILLTAKTEKEDIVQGLEAGANDYIPKPFNFDELIARIHVGQRMLNLQDEYVAELNERKRAEQDLRTSEEKYKTLIHTSPDAIALVDDAGRLVTVNPAMARRLGLDNQEPEGMRLQDFFSPNEADVLLSKGWEALEQDQPIFVEQENGDSIFQNYLVSIPSSGIGNFFQMITRDVSGIRKVQKDLEKALGKLDKAVHGTFQALSSTLEHRDAYTAGHQRRVAGLARAVALEMGLDEERIQGLYFAGLIHDLGKVCIPAELLTKPTRLTDIEFALIKEHARIGYNVLKDIEFPWPIADMVRQHHERIDGSGYPQGLTAEHVLFRSKILAVADVLEAMSFRRPYRPALGLEAALKEIEQNKGRLYDQEVVEVSVMLFRKKKFSF
ncbi:MAG: HD domain-containing phosphohydrolase [Thermodesulfobacteriota bacterium]